MFHLPAFVSQVEESLGMGEDEVHSHQRMITAMNIVLNNKHATPELLSQVSIQDLEWAFDMVLYWPGWEESSDEVDLNHQGVQSVQIRDMIHSFSNKESIKRKVDFI